MLERLREVARFEGAAGLLRRAGKRLLAPLIRIDRLLFIDTDLAGPLPPIEARVPLTMLQATIADLRRHADALREAGVTPEEAERRLAEGDIATIGLAADALAHVGWSSFSPAYLAEIDATLLLGPGEVASYQSYTFPRWRGAGVHRAMDRFRNRTQRQRGCAPSFGWVWADNAASMKNQPRLGRRPLKTVWRIGLLGLPRPLVLGVTATPAPRLVRGRVTDDGERR